VNRQHLSAFVWLRWRLFLNQMRRGGLANAVVLAVVVALIGLLALGLFVGFLIGGLFLPLAPPVVVLIVWDALVVLFLFAWLIGLVVELQRSEALPLTKFLHLPVALSDAFLINYLSSLFSPTLILFSAMFLGLSLAMVFAYGPALLLLLPLLLSFLFLVTALTYQLQGWLAALMANPRRRRTVILVATFSIILISQLPSLLGLLAVHGGPGEREKRLLQDEAELQTALAAGKFTPEEHRRRTEQLVKEYEAETTGILRERAYLVHVFVPPGWLPLGALALAEGNAVPALLGTTGLALLGAASLWRAYRTTLRLYTKQAGARKPACLV
jgi:hypothetical protein